MKTALFDLDGTLIDSREDLALAINLTRQDFDLPPLPTAAIVACIGEGVHVLVKRAIPERQDQMDALLARHRMHYTAHCLDNTVLYPEIKETLESLRAAGWRLAVVTNKPGVIARPILDGFGILHHFGAVVGGGDCPVLKPDPSALIFAASQMGVTLDATDWMVGDHFTDLESGRRAGVRRCFCRFGFGDAREETWDLEISRMGGFLSAVV